MKIAIISDIHDNLANVGHFFDLIKSQGIEKIICCGDVCSKETLVLLNKKTNTEIVLVRGNAELYEEADLKKLKNFKYLDKYGKINIDSLSIGVCHEPFLRSKLLEKNKNLDFIFYGHTHKPWISKIKNTTLINPGTLGGIFQKASFAIFDTEKKDLKLKILY